jgi:hypothetical protein
MDGKLLAEKLLCPKCQFIVAEPSAKAQGTFCPRCNTWLDMDPKCLGSCLSCHKMQEANPGPCLTESQEMPIKLEKAYGSKLLDVKGMFNATLNKVLGK